MPVKVKEIAALAAANLGREDLQRQAETLAGKPEGELASLLRCYNLVENEIALDYYPLKREESFLPVSGRIAYTRFSRAPVRIISAKDRDGKPLSFTVYADGLELSPPAAQAAVTYAYAPAEKAWEDDSEFSGIISARLLSFGVACEFCLSRGQVSEAALWEKRYRDALRAAGYPRGGLRVRSRRWA